MHCRAPTAVMYLRVRVKATRGFKSRFNEVHFYITDERPRERLGYYKEEDRAALSLTLRR